MSNAAQIDYWNGQAGETWVQTAAQTDRLLAPISKIVLERAAASAGERVVDIGCGCGTTSLELADAGANVWGVDISEPMLKLAKKRAGIREDVSFSVGDAAEQKFTPDHQLVFSRFGVMFFDQPAAAFANIRTSLVRGGRLCFVCWQAPRENPWMSIGGQAVAPFLPKPESPVDPRAPGPFAFADKGYLRSILQVAGFSQIKIESINPRLHVADSLDEAMEFQGRIGPVSRVLAELEGDAKAKALAAAREALAPLVKTDGLDLGAACWLVTARN